MSLNHHYDAMQAARAHREKKKDKKTAKKRDKKRDKKKKKEKKREKKRDDDDGDERYVRDAWHQKLYDEVVFDNAEPFAGWTDDDDDGDWYDSIARQMERKRQREEEREAQRRPRKRQQREPEREPERPPTPTQPREERAPPREPPRAPQAPREPTHYERLGVERTATPAAIRVAYLKLARQFHPDKELGHTEFMSILNHAKDVLTDPQARRLYDGSLPPIR